MTAVVATSRASRRGRVFGLRSVYSKTMRDSRPGLLTTVIALALLILSGGAAVASAFGTPELRMQAAELANALPPVMQGLLGPAVGLTTLGGLIEWRFFVVSFLMLPIWSILALSGTLAAEASRGSLEALAATGIPRRRIALEKVAAHLTAVGVALIAVTVVLLVTGQAFATLPGDEIGLDRALGYSILIGLMVLLPGSIAFAAATFVGRGAAAAVAGLAMVAAYFINGYRDALPLFETLSPLSWYSWTANHVPLAGIFDWPALAPMALLTVLFFVVGMVAFERRDLGSVARVPAPRLPTLLVGLRGVASRSFGERLPAALVWGAALGLYALVIAASIDSMTELFRRLPAVEQMIRAIYPDLDVTSVAGLLQLVFVGFGLVIFGFMAATIVGGWASDESTGRLEVVLATPLSRATWFVRSGLGAYGAIVLAAAIVAAATALGAASQPGGAILTPTIGSFVLALYGLALAGIGLAVGGLARPSLAAPVVAGLTIGWYLLVLLASLLDLPAWVGNLALSTHYGQPLTGSWDINGVIASVVLALGGLLVGTWGFARRDLRG